MNTLVFDIETVPDVELGRRLYDLHDLGDEDVAKAMFAKQRQRTHSDFLPPPQQRIVAISIVMRTRDSLKISSLGDLETSERDLVQRFFDGLERYTPVLVSWNGSGFDLPVLNYRALRHGVDAHRFWEMGESDRDFRYNNYLSRYHWRHVDVMDVLSGYGASGRASLEVAAQLAGLPGKLGIGGAQVWPSYLRGELGAIRDYCECDVLNTYLVFLRFQLVRGELDPVSYRRELEVVEAKLAESDRPHLVEYLTLWRASRHAT
jgi:predicted PolB exonuclease-like 3'-5' exonuclease